MEDSPDQFVGGRFAPTRWSLVQIAAMPSDEYQRQALAELLSAYIGPLRSHLCRKWRFAAPDADDAVQAFVVDQILQKKLLKSANKSIGKFRTFLLGCLDHYASNLIRDSKALKRGSGEVCSLPERLDPSDGSEGLLAEFTFEWARTILQRAIEQMRVSCVANGREDLWGVFENRVLLPACSSDDPGDYAELVSRFGWRSPREASNRLMTAKRNFARILREIVAEYIDDPANADCELLELQQILAISGAGSRT